MFTNSNKVKTLPPSFYGLETMEEVARHLMNIDFEYNPMKTAIAVWFGVPYNEVESLPGYVIGAMDRTPQGAVTGIAIIAGNRLQSIKAKVDAEFDKTPVSQDKLYQEAGVPKPVSIPKHANGKRKPLHAHPENFRKGLWIVESGSKDPRIHIFKDGYEITEDGKPTYGSGRRWVSWAYTTMDSNVTGEQLLAWQQQRRDNRRAE